MFVARYLWCFLLYLCRLVACGVLPGHPEGADLLEGGVDTGLLGGSGGGGGDDDGYGDIILRRFRKQSETDNDIVKTSKCRGGFDIYFVLDKSGSVSEVDFQKQTVNFAEALLNRFTSSKIRASFITFSSEAQVITPLTGESSDLAKGIKQLRLVITDGGTNLHTGIKAAKKQIAATGGDTASVIVTLTDGVLDDKNNAISQANAVRALGGSVLAVRVGDSTDITDILDVADKPSSDHIFRGDTFNDLDTIIDRIVNTSCVEILSASPTEVCTGETFNVTIKGNGFTKTTDMSKVRCNFRLNDTDNQEVWPYLVTDSKLVCPAPHIETTDSFVVLLISVNGISYISSNVTITAKDCTPPDVTGIVLGVLFSLIALGLFLLWWFWKLICCVVVVKEPPPKPLPPPSPTSKKWPTVDASYYGGGGIGGIKAVRVNWGENGCTEAGAHLEKAKGAKLLAMNEEGVDGNLREGRPGCIENLKSKLGACFAPIRSFYDRVSVMRPAPGEKGYCCKIKR